MAHTQSPRAKKPTSGSPLRLYLYAGAYSVMLGFGLFFMRYLGVQDTGLGTFLVNWYGGVIVAALGLVLLLPEEANDPTTLSAVPWGDRLRIGGLNLVVLTAMSAAYTAYRLAPQTVVQPLFLVGEMIAPALIGLYVFAEREALDRYEQLVFAAGLAGGLLVALSFS
jgi:fructose-specific phosphotransferase system IIC component